MKIVKNEKWNEMWVNRVKEEYKPNPTKTILKMFYKDFLVEIILDYDY